MKELMNSYDPDMQEEFFCQKNKPSLTVPERFLKKAELYERLLTSVAVAGWSLIELSKNFRTGVSVYGFFRYGGGSKGVKDVKVRLSDHAGRWSGYDLDLRDPKDRDMQALIRCLSARSR